MTSPFFNPKVLALLGAWRTGFGKHGPWDFGLHVIFSSFFSISGCKRGMRRQHLYPCRFFASMSVEVLLTSPMQQCSTVCTNGPVWKLWLKNDGMWLWWWPSDQWAALDFLTRFLVTSPPVSSLAPCCTANIKRVKLASCQEKKFFRSTQIFWLLLH